MLPAHLRDGYASFRTNRYEDESARYRKLAEGQRPTTLVIACCDSRAAPETVFDAGPGELFVLRNVANLVPPYQPDGEFHGTSAALEFAVMALRVQHVVVMGHGRCGGIAAALDDAFEPLSPGDFIGRWVTLLEPALQSVAAEGALSPTARQKRLERLSVANTLANLRSFPCVSGLEAKGRLALHGAWFDIAEGELWELDEASGRWTAVTTETLNAAAE